MSIDYVSLLCVCATVAAIFALLLIAKSILSFTQTGPEIRDEVRKHYAVYTALAMARLGVFTFLVLFWAACLGAQAGLAIDAEQPTTNPNVLIAISSVAGIGTIVLLQFCKHLLLIPSSIMMNSNYSMQWLIGLNRQLSVSRLRWFEMLILATFIFASNCILTATLEAGDARESLIFSAYCSALATPYLFSRFSLPGLGRRARVGTNARPNLVMIGSDTLRADHIGARIRQQPLTPFIDSLATQGALFNNCLVSIARTAPSLVSLFTGTWPNTNGIKTNYIAADKTGLEHQGLAAILAEHGYATAAITDWSGTDLNKFPLGFEHFDGPSDQWNIKYLIRQGPKDMRLFLSLFAHNRLAKALLPEIYYLAGKPMTAPVSHSACNWLRRFGSGGHPFFLNVFVSSTHPPFGSEYPYYTYFSNPEYRGESTFGMSRLTDPAEIIRSQREPREAFDLDQVMDLYRGCVRNFDDGTRRIISELRRLGLDDNTLVVIYSDHGMEFFENDTWGQGNSIRGHSSNRIPLLIVDPKDPRAFATDTLVRSIDILPTILVKLEIPVPASAEGNSLQPLVEGKSFPELTGFCETGEWLATPPGQHPDHIRYPELLQVLDVPDRRKGTFALRSEYADIIETARDRSIQRGEWRLIRIALETTPRYELYHLATDPDCRIDRAAELPDVVRKMTELMNAFA